MGTHFASNGPCRSWPPLVNMAQPETENNASIKDSLRNLGIDREPKLMREEELDLMSRKFSTIE